MPDIDIDFHLFDGWFLPPLVMALGVPLVFERCRRSRAFAAASLPVAAVTLWSCLARDARAMRMLALVLVGLLGRALWRLVARPRPLYVPPPDPPALGGPYR